MKKSMRIGVLADTHDRLPVSVVEAMANMDEIWHLGDVCRSATLKPLRALGCPVLVVQGNRDRNRRWPASLIFQRKGIMFYLTHVPHKSPPLGTKVFLHGHTHVPRDERIGSCRYLNPGAIGRANKGAPPSFAFLTIDRLKRVRWSLQRV
ncbi:MAG: metallophosphoesterase family protein [Verrucomicrobiota bacterium]